jgi:hypothetical protein
MHLICQFFYPHLFVKYFIPFLISLLFCPSVLDQGRNLPGYIISNSIYYTYIKVSDFEYGIAGKAGLLYNLNRHFAIYGEFRTSYTEISKSWYLDRVYNRLFNFSIGLYM